MNQISLPSSKDPIKPPIPVNRQLKTDNLFKSRKIINLIRPQLSKNLRKPTTHNRQLTTVNRQLKTDNPFKSREIINLIRLQLSKNLRKPTTDNSQPTVSPLHLKL